jgi:hypothetical protein
MQHFFAEFTDAPTFAQRQKVKLENLGRRVEHLSACGTECDRGEA